MKKVLLIIFIIFSVTLFSIIVPPVLLIVIDNYEDAEECRREFYRYKDSYQAIADMLVELQEKNGYNSYFCIDYDRDCDKYDLIRVYKINKKYYSETLILSDEDYNSLEIVTGTFKKFAGGHSSINHIYATRDEVIFTGDECTRGQVILSRNFQRTLGNIGYSPKEYKKYADKIELGEEWYSYYYYEGL